MENNKAYKSNTITYYLVPALNRWNKINQITNDRCQFPRENKIDSRSTIAEEKTLALEGTHTEKTC